MIYILHHGSRTEKSSSFRSQESRPWFLPKLFGSRAVVLSLMYFLYSRYSARVTFGLTGRLEPTRINSWFCFDAVSLTTQTVFSHSNSVTVCRRFGSDQIVLCRVSSRQAPCNVTVDGLLRYLSIILKFSAICSKVFYFNIQRKRCGPAPNSTLYCSVKK
ncbi:hypothetical protein B0H34DRAFT_687803 [Crassisporium funariophilum]|nr:hypothetical protein B0H34DRAFT_687803 [Crassisporium funariophilum]